MYFEIFYRENSSFFRTLRVSYFPLLTFSTEFLKKIFHPLKNKFFYLSFLLIFSTIFSINTNAAKGYSIAVVDPLEAVRDSDMAKGLIADIKQDLMEQKDKLISLESEIKDLMKKQDTDSAIMSEQQRRKIAKEIEDKKFDLNYMQAKFQKSQQEGPQEILKVLQPKFERALKSILEKKKYDIVLQRQVVIHFSNAIDITADVTKKMNELK